MSIVFSIDTGNRMIKTDHFVFPAGLLTQDSIPLYGLDENTIEVSGRYYSSTDNIAYYMRDKTTNDDYYYLTLLAIAKELEMATKDTCKAVKDRNIYEVTLLVGLPPAHNNLKKKFADYFKRGKVEDVTYNGQTYRILVGEIHVYAQGMAAAMTEFTEISQYEDALVIDLGGMTMDYIGIHNKNGMLAPDPHLIDSVENGLNTLYERIRKDCRSLDYEPTDRNIDTLLTADPSTVELKNSGHGSQQITIHKGENERKIFAAEGVYEIIQKTAKDYITEILMIFLRKNIRLRQYYTIFEGGGGILLHRFISENELLGPHKVVTDLAANAKGYRLMYNISTKRKN